MVKVCQNRSRLRTATATWPLRAGAGRVTVAVRNRDLFWHTFTIDRLGVEVRSPVGRLRTATFEARPGRYSFYCAIPGHATLGMRGTLTVR